ncbi:MAG: F0F1 ATP synthase subunit epsilon [Hyphomicrobium sp.]|jgi:F-type H+-transporting ATPase subunit epsilon|nr:F0F1 ATP synthase subunit epsilon [Hyphomicrobium sp.]
MSTIRVEVVSAEAEIFKGEAKLVVVSGEMGDLGIAPRHAPLITRIKPGQVRIIKPDDEELFLYVSGGILEVQPTVVTILADSAVRAADLDEAKARQTKEDAEKAILNRTDAIEVAEAQAQLAQSLAQLQALERLRKTLKH